MLNNLWSTIRQLFGLEGSWEIMTLSRVGIDPTSARELTRVLQPAHTIRLRPEPAIRNSSPQPELVWHGITDTGLVRAHNEDTLMLSKLGNDAFFVVADGMGGHDAGEVASSIAAETVLHAIQEGRARNEDPKVLVRSAVEAANMVVRGEAMHRKSNMGTTLTAALVRERTAYIASVGDSRAYWIADSAIMQITKDHSLVAKLVELGKLTKEEARTDPRANLLTRTIGSEASVEVDTWQVSLSPGGTLLLCTDGLWGEVEDEDIRRVCLEEQHTEVACARLVQLANANGGRDNISAIAIRVA